MSRLNHRKSTSARKALGREIFKSDQDGYVKLVRGTSVVRFPQSDPCFDAPFTASCYPTGSIRFSLSDIRHNVLGFLVFVSSRVCFFDLRLGL
jgi:hypothetical protein